MQDIAYLKKQVIADVDARRRHGRRQTRCHEKQGTDQQKHATFQFTI